MDSKWLTNVYGIDNGLHLSDYNRNLSNSDFKISNLTLSASKIFSFSVYEAI